MLHRGATDARTWAVRLFERVLRVQTQGDVLSSGWVVLWRLFRALEVSPEDVFVDLGSGKGRVLYMAARRPFKRVLGVERSEELNEVARANLERNQDRLRAGRVDIEAADVEVWEVPDDVTVVYLYIAFPFAPEIPEGLVEKLRVSVERNPRTLRLILPDPLPEHLERVLADWRLKPLRELLPFYLRGRLPERATLATLGEK
jgi:SAM-dependent methyltransferase